MKTVSYEEQIMSKNKYPSKSERSDWFFLGRDFAIRTVTVEMVISCVFFVFESRKIQNKHGPSAIQ